jgi:hypothetical protein
VENNYEEDAIPEIPDENPNLNSTSDNWNAISIDKFDNSNLELVNETSPNVQKVDAVLQP